MKTENGPSGNYLQKYVKGVFQNTEINGVRARDLFIIFKFAKCERFINVC